MLTPAAVAVPRSYDRIYAVVRQIPAGQVATYGQVAALAGLAGRARLVGYALYRLGSGLGQEVGQASAIDPTTIPWQRVVNARGEISHSIFRQGSDDLQRVLLEAEGIVFNPAGRLDLRRYRWTPLESPPLHPR